MSKLTLVETLEAHLKHIYDMLVGNANNRHNAGEKMNDIFRQVQLMLALIEGSKED